MTSTIYVVEFFDEKGHWIPADGALASRSKEYAEEELRQDQADNPEVRFRVGVYERVSA